MTQGKPKSSDYPPKYCPPNGNGERLWKVLFSVLSSISALCLTVVGYAVVKIQILEVSLGKFEVTASILNEIRLEQSKLIKEVWNNTALRGHFLDTLRDYDKRIKELEKTLLIVQKEKKQLS